MPPIAIRRRGGGLMWRHGNPCRRQFCCRAGCVITRPCNPRGRPPAACALPCMCRGGEPASAALFGTHAPGGGGGGAKVLRKGEGGARDWRGPPAGTALCSRTGRAATGFMTRGSTLPPGAASAPSRLPTLLMRPRKRARIPACAAAAAPALPPCAGPPGEGQGVRAPPLPPPLPPPPPLACRRRWGAGRRRRKRPRPAAGRECHPGIQSFCNAARRSDAAPPEAALDCSARRAEYSTGAGTASRQGPVRQCSALPVLIRAGRRHAGAPTMRRGSCATRQGGTWTRACRPGACAARTSDRKRRRSRPTPKAAA